MFFLLSLQFLGWRMGGEIRQKERKGRKRNEKKRQ